VVGFLTPYILKELQTRHYEDVEMIGYSSIVGSIFSLIKFSLIMLGLFIILIPLYFIPLINIIAFSFPFYYFFHKMLKLDVSSNITTSEEEKKINYFNKNSLRLKTLVLYLISLIPFAIFFGAVFYIIYLGNSYFTMARELRTSKVV
jgi:beta-lactamase regulating signal transducer with metallopeptidase domain